MRQYAACLCLYLLVGDGHVGLFPHIAICGRESLTVAFADDEILATDGEVGVGFDEHIGVAFIAANDHLAGRCSRQVGQHGGRPVVHKIQRHTIGLHI